MVTCPRCGNPMTRWEGGWFACPRCKLAGHIDTLEWLRAALTEARIRAEGRYASDGTLPQI
jgi:endogenous inhibitor of DNA gyrase (YacG/DUF329 family)